MVHVRNMFLLFLIANYDKGKGDPNFLHEVHVISRTHPSLNYVGCIIDGGRKVLVPKFNIPDLKMLSIHYRNATGQVVETKVQNYKLTKSASLRILIPHESIPLSEYAKEAFFLHGLDELEEAIRKNPVALVNRAEQIFPMTLEDSDNTVLTDDKRHLFRLVVENYVDNLPKGASLVLPPNDEHSLSIVIGMHEQSFLRTEYDPLGYIFFNIVDSETTKVQFKFFF